DRSHDGGDVAHPGNNRGAMTDLLLTLKLVHVLGAAVLFGTGLGIAFFMYMAHRTGNAATIAATGRIVVIADALFTATAVIVEPVAGGLLAWIIGYSPWESWIVASLALYVMVGLCWLPVVAIQIRLRDLALEAVPTSAPLPSDYRRLFRIWFW